MFKIYEVDPDADTLLIVPHPTEPFAPWDAERAHSSYSPPTSPSPSPSPSSTIAAAAHDASSSSSSSVYAGILRGTSRPYNPYARAASSFAPAPAPTPETRIKVSSRHLSLASRRFRDRLRHLLDDSEQHRRGDDGRVHIVLAPAAAAAAAYDPAAVIIAMDAVHGRARKVPRALDLETLARVAVFVDAFRCTEAVEVYAERWLDGLLLQRGGGGDEMAVREEYGRDLVLWMYVSYVFRRGDVFRRATRTAVLKSDGPVRGLGLHVREGIIKEIDAQRQRLIRKALGLVNDTIDALQEDKASCALGCDTFVLGALVRALRRRKLVWPEPPAPFAGVSFSAILEAVGEAQAQAARFAPGLLLDDPSGAARSRKRKSQNVQPGHALTPDSSPEPGLALDAHECGAKTDLMERLSELGAAVEGLQLESKLGFCLY